MYRCEGTGTAQEISTAKLPVLSKILKESMVTKGFSVNSLTTLKNLRT